MMFPFHKHKVGEKGCFQNKPAVFARGAKLAADLCFRRLAAFFRRPYFVLAG
jgi:hypothetical protein